MNDVIPLLILNQPTCIWFLKSKTLFYSSSLSQNQGKDQTAYRAQAHREFINTVISMTSLMSMNSIDSCTNEEPCLLLNQEVKWKSGLTGCRRH
jgi:hypothetical protein